MQIKLTGEVDSIDLGVFINSKVRECLDSNLPHIIESYFKENPIEPVPVKKTRHVQSSILTDDTGKSLSILNWSIETGLSILTIINRKRKEWSDNDTIHTPFHYHKISENI